MAERAPSARTHLPISGKRSAGRTLSFKWPRKNFRDWHDRAPYDEAAYLAALKRRGSPIAIKLEEPSPKPPDFTVNKIYSKPLPDDLR